MTGGLVWREKQERQSAGTVMLLHARSTEAAKLLKQDLVL